jgi:hypothetical protein
MFKQRLGVGDGHSALEAQRRYQCARWRRGGGVSGRLLTGGSDWLKFKRHVKTDALCGADDTGERENRSSNFWIEAEAE